MNRCPRCGTISEDNSRFCSECGYDLNTEEETKVYSKDEFPEPVQPEPEYPAQSYQEPDTVYDEPEKPPAKKGNGKVILITVAVILLLALTAGGAFFFGRKSNEPETTTTVTETETQTTTETTTESTTRALVPSEISDKTKASNVGIKVESEEYDIVGEGSGFIWKEIGEETYIVTCAHVIDYYGFDITVQTEDGSEYDAEVVGYDVKSDIGLIKIRETGLQLVEIGDSSELKVGDPVYAVGNPDGAKFFGTFTSGHVTAMNRSLTSGSGYDMKCIQHDATINPGNSGGMLVNQYGEVVGVNSSKWVKVGFEGMDFAVPINDALELLDQLLDYGYIPGRPKLGLRYITLNDTYYYDYLAYQNDWPVGSMIIVGVDSDAQLDGSFNYFDVVTTVNGQELDDVYSIIKILNQSHIGDTLNLTVLRIFSEEHIERFNVEVTLVQDRGGTRVYDLPETVPDPTTTEPESTRRGLFNFFDF